MIMAYSLTWRTVTTNICVTATIRRRRRRQSKDSLFTTNSGYLVFYDVNAQNQCKRSCLVTSSAEPSSSCSSSQPTTVKTCNISFKNAKTVDGSISVVHSDVSGLRVEEQKATENGTGQVSKNKKRFSWRKILSGSNKLKSIALLNVITIVYASDIPVIKAVEEVMDPAAFSAVRFIMSAVPFLPFVFRARSDVKTRNAGIELGLWVSLGYFVEALGLLTSDAGRASFLSLFTVIVVTLLDGMLGAMVPARTWFGVLMSGLGVAMLETSGSPPNVGDLLNFLSAIFFGIHMLRTEHFSRSTKKENFLPLLGYEICVVALLSTIWVIVGGWFDGNQEIDQASWTWPVLWEWIIAFPWIPAVYTGLFSTGLCLWAEIAAMRDVSATEAAIIYGLEPMWGAGFAWFLLGERWGTAGWIGAALVLCGSLMVQIYGASTSSNALNTEKNEQEGNVLLISDKQKLQKGLSASPVVVRSRKEDILDMLK